MAGLQFFCRKTNHNLLEIVEWFDADKVRVGFREFDMNAETGNKNKSSIDFYFTIPELELLCHNILSGNTMAKIKAKGFLDPVYKGSERDGKVYARIFSLGQAKVGAFFTAAEGPGEKLKTGAVKPLYQIKDAKNKVSIALTPEEMKSFALQGKRACDMYYAQYFGKTEGTKVTRQ